MFGQCLPRGECVGHFVEGGLHGALVGFDENFLLRFGDVHRAVQFGAVEDGQGDARHDAPAQVRRFEHLVEFGAAVADVAGEADARVERRARRADVGVGRFELVFGFADVRTVLQDGGGDAARQAQVGKGFFEVARRRQVELAYRFAN